MERAKRAHYGKAFQDVIPFIISANGSLGPSAKSLLDCLTQLSHPDDIGARSTWRKDILGRLSLVLIRAGGRIAALHGRHTLNFVVSLFL